MSRHMWRTGDGKRWIDQRPFGNDPPRRNTNFHETVRVRYDSDGTDFRACAGGCGNPDDVDYRAGHGVFAVILRQGARVTKQNSRALAEIHVASAADSDDHIGIELARGFCGCVDGFQIDFRASFGKDEDFASAVFQQRFDSVSNTAFDDVAVGADHDALAEFLADVAEFFQNAPAKKHSSR